MSKKQDLSVVELVAGKLADKMLKQFDVDAFMKKYTKDVEKAVDMAVKDILNNFSNSVADAYYDFSSGKVEAAVIAAAENMIVRKIKGKK